MYCVPVRSCHVMYNHRGVIFRASFEFIFHPLQHQRHTALCCFFFCISSLSSACIKAEHLVQLRALLDFLPIIAIVLDYSLFNAFYSQLLHSLCVACKSTTSPSDCPIQLFTPNFPSCISPVQHVNPPLPSLTALHTCSRQTFRCIPNLFPAVSFHSPHIT